MMLASTSFMPPVPLRSRPISLSICIHFFVHQLPTTTCLFSTQAVNECRKRGTHAVNRPRRDQGRAVGASVSSVYTGEMEHGTSDGGEKKPGATAGPAARSGTLVSCGIRDHF